MAASVKSSPNTPQFGSNDRTPTIETQKMSQYEQSREQRIRENRERLEKLGIADLSLKLKAQTSQRRTRLDPSHCKSPQRASAPKPSGPLRRSSRLQNVIPVSYSEVHPKNDESLENGKFVTDPDSKPEIYTEEHEKLLGNTEKPWTLFVDGYGKDGKRIYDSINGKTCHQCRQKTLGYRTQCSQCNMVQGQFCGDCLYMRYGEHVLEALQNPSWICPVCRGICNCSLCRQAKGWPPTGYLYRKVSALGYKSVAHFLIQTRRGGANVEKDADDSVPVSAEKSPPVSDVGGLSNESLEVNENSCVGSLKPQSEDDGGQVSAKRSLLFSDVQDQHDKGECLDTVKHQSGNDRGQVSAKRSLPFSDVQDQDGKVACLDSVIASASSTEVKDCIARRLRPRVQRS
ncbi:cell division cycle-associated protein 7 [Neltuma alba]|uniref:cell division cycle-associated protein 7 n=1 Tax=Neltuma alba TaxID=207710 RepID=UPI0010A43146|nr:cell division cycle-associated protein 7 [Prosopis alba]